MKKILCEIELDNTSPNYRNVYVSVAGRGLLVGQLQEADLSLLPVEYPELATTRTDRKKRKKAAKTVEIRTLPDINSLSRKDLLLAACAPLGSVEYFSRSYWSRDNLMNDWVMLKTPGDLGHPIEFNPLCIVGHASILLENFNMVIKEQTPHDCQISFKHNDETYTVYVSVNALDSYTASVYCLAVTRAAAYFHFVCNSKTLPILPIEDLPYERPRT